MKLFLFFTLILFCHNLFAASVIEIKIGEVTKCDGKTFATDLANLYGLKICDGSIVLTKFGTVGKVDHVWDRQNVSIDFYNTIDIGKDSHSIQFLGLEVESIAVGGLDFRKDGQAFYFTSPVTIKHIFHNGWALLTYTKDFNSSLGLYLAGDFLVRVEALKSIQ